MYSNPSLEEIIPLLKLKSIALKSFDAFVKLQSVYLLFVYSMLNCPWSAFIQQALNSFFVLTSLGVGTGDGLLLLLHEETITACNDDKNIKGVNILNAFLIFIIVLSYKYLFNITH